MYYSTLVLVLVFSFTVVLPAKVHLLTGHTVPVVLAENVPCSESNYVSCHKNHVVWDLKICVLERSCKHELSVPSTESELHVVELYIP